MRLMLIVCSWNSHAHIVKLDIDFVNGFLKNSGFVAYIA